MNHSTCIALSGGLWLAIGIFLLNLGLTLTIGAATATTAPLLDLFTPLAGGRDGAAIIIIVFALAIGYYKAKRVFSRVVRKGVERLLALPTPITITQVYTSRYLLLIAFMMLLGVAMRLLPPDIRGLVDVAVGAALINGGVSYLRHACAARA